jgi:hypothetical protein
MTCRFSSHFLTSSTFFYYKIMSVRRSKTIELWSCKVAYLYAHEVTYSPVLKYMKQLIFYFNSDRQYPLNKLVN